MKGTSADWEYVLSTRFGCIEVFIRSSTWLLVCDSNEITMLQGGDIYFRGDTLNEGRSWASWITCSLKWFSRLTSRCLLFFLCQLALHIEQYIYRFLYK